MPYGAAYAAFRPRGAHTPAPPLNPNAAPPVCSGLQSPAPLTNGKAKAQDLIGVGALGEWRAALIHGKFGEPWGSLGFVNYISIPRSCYRAYRCARPAPPSDKLPGQHQGPALPDAT